MCFRVKGHLRDLVGVAVSIVGSMMMGGGDKSGTTSTMKQGVEHRPSWKHWVPTYFGDGPCILDIGIVLVDTWLS